MFRRLHQRLKIKRALGERDKAPALNSVASRMKRE
jgi:hypothetical protein